MAREEFIQDVRRVMLHLAPRVEVDNPLTDAAQIQRMLHGTDLWLSNRNVEAFDPADFADLGQGVRDDLTQAVEEFRQVAEAVDPRAPIRAEQRVAASGPFQRIVEIVQHLVFQEWLAASNNLLSQAETWAREEGWPTKRFSWEVTEDFIGRYCLDRLDYEVDGAQLALIPLGRFAPGSDGMFDLAVMPAYDSIPIAHERGRWYVHPLPGEGRRDIWSKDVFIQKGHALASLA